MVYVYILKSLSDNGYYVGITKDVSSRITQHNTGKVKSTKKRKPFELVYTETFESYKQARLREIEIKSFKGGNKLKELLGI